MSVLATLDLQNGEWSFDVAPESPAPDVEIGFKFGGSPVDTFDNLFFGFSATVDGSKVFEKSYPPEGIRYVATDQKYLSNDRVLLSVNDKVVFRVWAENAGQRYEGETVFVVPIPDSPYPSWVWDGEDWQPPVPYPSESPANGDGWAWDEESLSWVEFNLADYEVE